MKMVPDFNRIGSVVSSWHRGVITAEEAEQRIRTAMDQTRYLPVSEMVPLPQPDESMRILVAAVERVEQKLNLVIRHNGIHLPDAVNPGILSSDVRELARKNQKIEAVALHRRNTGAGLAETCDLIQRYLQDHSLP